MSDEWKQLNDAGNELARQIRAILAGWGIRGLVIRLVLITIALELIFVVIPWAWHAWA